jgi:hypothetical protein
MMNNHTASTLLFTVVLGTSLLMNVPQVKRATSAPQQTTQGKGIIKISDTADSHIAIPDVTADSTPSGAQYIDIPATKATEKSNFNNVITKNLLKVRAIAKDFGNHETMQAILLQESNGGTSHPVGNLASPVGKRSYGIMQVQVVAARSILSRYPHIATKYFPARKPSTLTDEEIIALLLRNDEANIRIASQHFDLYLSLSHGNWEKAVAAYNMGIGNANKRSGFGDIPYVKSIRARIHKSVKPFNQQHTGSLSL